LYVEYWYSYVCLVRWKTNKREKINNL